MVAIHFGKNLARCRRRQRMSQEELAALTELHRTEISLLERGRRGGRVDTLVRLAGALAVDLDELLDGVAWMPGYEGRSGKFVITPPLPEPSRPDEF